VAQYILAGACVGGCSFTSWSGLEREKDQCLTIPLEGTPAMTQNLLLGKGFHHLPSM
jgi:hypothetical protein